MKALIRNPPTKSPSSLSLSLSHPEPTPNATTYTLLTHTCALTREELTWPEPLEASIPIPAYDVAGTILALPTAPKPDGTPWKFKEGDEVYALTTPTRQGNAREVSEVQEAEMALRPRNVGWEEVGSVPLSALSAWQALFVHGLLKPQFEGQDGGNANEGKRVLVTAASGGVGVWAIQMCARIGVEEVVGSCGTGNVGFVKGLGADVVLDYKKTDLLEWVGEDRDKRGFDVVLDCVGGKTLVDAWKCARKGGRVVSVAEPPEGKKPEVGIAEGVEGVWFIVECNGGQLSKVTGLIEEGGCKPVVDSVFELRKWEEAFERLEGGHARGKVVLKLI